MTVTPTAVNHSKPQINLKKIYKLKKELSFFQQLLKMERNEVRRNLLLGHIQNVEEQMLKLIVKLKLKLKLACVVVCLNQNLHNEDKPLPFF